MKKLTAKIIDNYHSILALVFGLISIIICINPYFLLRIYPSIIGYDVCLFFGIPFLTSFLAVLFGGYTIITNIDDKKDIFYIFGLFGVVEASLSFILFLIWLGSPFNLMT